MDTRSQDASNPLSFRVSRGQGASFVVTEAHGRIGGVFGDLSSAMRFARLEAVNRGLARDPKSLPQLERSKNGANGAATVELLKVLLRMTAERHAVAAKIIATVDDLERIAADDDADVPALHGWRRELFGDKALALKHGKLALAVEKGRVIAAERNSDLG